MLRDHLVENRTWMPLLIAGLWFLLTLPASAQEPMVLSKGLQDLASQVAANVSKEQKRRVAVLPFQDIAGRETVLGSFVAEELITHLFNTESIQIVERGMLDKILDEVELGGTGLIDPETAQKVGKLAGVDAIVTGSITDLQSFVAINARLIDTETGLLFAAAQVKIVRDDDVKKIMAMALPANGINESEVPKPAGKEPNIEGPIKRQEPTVQRQDVQGLRVELLSCVASGSALKCNFMITSLETDKRMRFGRARFFDDLGNEVGSRLVHLGNASGDLVSKDLVAGVPTKASIEFDGISGQARMLAALEVFGMASSGFSLKFRNVGISH